MNGVILLNKIPGMTSFGVIERMKRMLIGSGKYGKKSDLPKLGHGGTLDPFATGLLLVCVGRGVKLARYFLGSDKTYSGKIRFGETTIPGDPTEKISERSDHLPVSLSELRDLAHKLTLQPYLQTPPMHSAKKVDGKPLYELARQGIEIEREPKLCHLYRFDVNSYSPPHAEFSVHCSSGTYIRTLAQDYSRLLGTVGLLETLHRDSSGQFHARDAWTLAQLEEAIAGNTPWTELPCWIPFDRMLEGFCKAEATSDEAQSLFRGQQGVLFNILRRAEESQGRDSLAIYCKNALIAVAKKNAEAPMTWELERVFIPGDAS